MSFVEAMTGQPKTQDPRPKTAPAPRTAERITRFDPRHARQADAAMLRALAALHEPLGTEFAAALATLLRSKVDVASAGVEPLTYAQFTSDLPLPACFHRIRAEPLAADLALDFAPSIVLAMIDRMLGGGLTPAPVARRRLTQIELRLARRVTDLFLGALGRAWQNVLALELTVAEVESDPRQASLVPAADLVYVLAYELSLSGLRGAMRLCIPSAAIEPLRGKLLPDGGPAEEQETSGPSDATTPRRGARRDGDPGGGLRGDAGRLSVELVVRLARTRISREELASLRVGDIITTEAHVAAPLEVELNGVERLRAAPGAFEGRKAIRIERGLVS